MPETREKISTDVKIKNYAEIDELCRTERSKGKIVFTVGCYDLLHLGHVAHFNDCKKFGDILIVAVGKDETVRQLKGNGRPIFKASARARMVAALEIVDYVVISEESGKIDHSRLIEIIKPNFFVVNDDDSHKTEKKKLIESLGGEIKFVKRKPPEDAPHVSTTSLIEKLRRL